MRKIDLGQTIGILANIGVIAGVVFLGVEIRQSTNLAMAQAQQERMSQLDDSFRSLANSESLPEIFATYEAEGFDALSAEDQLRFIWQSCSGLTRLDTVHAWYERGFMDEEEYDESMRRLVIEFAPRWQEIGIAPTRPAFRAEVERILREANSSAELPERSAC